MKINQAFVTGGAGFIGSHIVDQLRAEGVSVTVFDSLKTGDLANLEKHQEGPGYRFIRGDVLDQEALLSGMAGADAVFHFQANADVRGGITQTRVDLEQNTIATWNVLDAARRHGVKTFVFASSATVYGEPKVFPTSEDHPLIQTSLYGASKAAGESMIQAYSEYYGIRSLIFRFVSWIGTRYSHGVIFDFMTKLRANPKQLEVLGDGKQQKSYLDVRDGVSGIFAALHRAPDQKNVFNLGHDDFINVLEVARIITEELGLKDVFVQTTGGERGWLGDSPIVHLETTRIKSLDWRPRVSIPDGIRSTVQHLLAHPHMFERHARK